MTSAPKGNRASLANLKCWIPKGMPIIVQQKTIPRLTCATANSKPPKMSHKILSRNLPAPPPYWISFPKGKKLKDPNLKHCIPTGMPMMVQHQSKPIRYQPKPVKMPPKRNQIILPNKLMKSHPFKKPVLT